MAETDTPSGAKSAPGHRSPGLAMLPNELILGISEHLDVRALKALAFTSTHYNKLLKPVLFQNLDLSIYSPAQLTRLYRHLFHPTQDNRGTLFGAHFRSISYRLVEGASTDQESAESLDLLIDILDRIGSVTVLTLEISLLEAGTARFERNVLLPLRQSLASRALRGTHFKLWLDVDAGGSNTSAGQASQSVVIQKVSSILSLFRDDSIVSLLLGGLNPLALPKELHERLSSTALKELALKELSSLSAFGLSASNLECLRMSWMASRATAPAGFQTALQLVDGNANSLRRLVLHNLTGDTIIPFSPVQVSRTELSHLTEIHITDISLGDGCILNCLLSHTHLPKLKVLSLEVQDIFQFNKNFVEMLHQLPALQEVKISEYRMGSDTQAVLDSSAYEALEEACTELNIVLRSTYWCPRCDTEADLKREFHRMAALSRSLTTIDLNCQPTVATGFHDLPSREFPHVRTLCIAVGNTQPPNPGAPGQSLHLPSQHKPLLYHLLSRLRAPNCVELMITVLVDDQSVQLMFHGLQQALEDRLYPQLAKLTGHITVLPGTSSEALSLCQAGVQGLCSALRIEGHALKFTNK